jgi:CRISPR-associated endonuclease/helicase Cas3
MLAEDKQYYKYWGKASKYDGHFHLLPYHSLDVASVAYVLLEQHQALRNKLSQLTGLEAGVLTRWVIFLFALHDLGKFSQCFQNLRVDLMERLQGRKADRSGLLRHDSLGYMFWHKHILNLLQDEGWLSVKSARSKRSINYWAMAVTGHHGQPPKLSGGFDDHFSPQDCTAAEEFTNAVAGLFLGKQSELVEPEIPAARETSWWLAGLAVLCDWLGSNRDYFPYQARQISLQEYWQQAITQAGNAIAKAELLPDHPADRQDFKDLFNWQANNPTPLQIQCANVRMSGGPGLFLLEDVTGAGKTEAALMLVHRLMNEGQGEGIYFALPTMATANAMYQRMAGVYQNLFAAGTKPSLILAHGARELSAQFRQSIIPESQNCEQDNGDGTIPAGTHCSAWLADNRKKAFLAEVGIGTIDQALLAVLPSRHQSLRLLGLLGKVLVVDEVHACDAYMNQLLGTLLTAQAMAGGSVVLLSATLPTAQRRALLDAFAKGLGRDDVKLQKTGNLDYPLFTHYSADGIFESVVETRESVKRHLKVELLHAQNEVEAKIRDAVMKGKCVCWIRNTVDHARQAYADLRDKYPDWNIALFHARYAMDDRLNIENRIVTRFGEASTAVQRTGQVLVATQVVEQSLDLDFDLMVTDLAPMDLIIQRAGRLCRHSRDEQGNRIRGRDRRGVPTLIVNSPDPQGEIKQDWFDAYFPRAGAVYPHHGQLWLTASLLSEKGGFSMPEDARILIEGVYGDADYPDALQQRAAKAEGDTNASRCLGVLNSLKLEAGYGGAEENIWWDEAITPTRLGEDSIIVYLARWRDGQLTSWVQQGEHRWQRSAVQVRRSLIAEEAAYDDIPNEVMAVCRESLPANGKWGVLVPLIHERESEWYGYAKDLNRLIRKVIYSAEQGVEVLKDRGS